MKANSQKGVVSLILPIVIISVVALVGFGLFKSGVIHLNKGTQEQKEGQRPGGAEDFGGPPDTAKKSRWNGPIPKPPSNKITYYKGLWSGNLVYPEEYTGLKIDPEKYKSWGVNIVNIAPGFEINSKGDVRYPPDFPTYEDLDARIGELAEKFYKNNIHLTMTVLITYKKDFSKPGEKWAGEPVEISEKTVSQRGYLDNFNRIVEDMAKIAQKYHFEMFSPTGEPENIFGVKVASSWNQEILPKVKKYYKGKVFYKGDLHKGQGDNLNFKGYDVLGIVPSPQDTKNNPEAFREAIASDMDRGLAWAKRDGVPQVMIAEYGFKKGNEMEPAEYIGIVLEESSKKLNGIFLSDPFPSVLKTTQGEQIVDVMKKWFKE